jgi:hypothetical protein
MNKQLRLFGLSIAACFLAIISMLAIPSPMVSAFPPPALAPTPVSLVSPLSPSSVPVTHTFGSTYWTLRWLLNMPLGQPSAWSPGGAMVTGTLYVKVDHSPAWPNYPQSKTVPVPCVTIGKITPPTKAGGMADFRSGYLKCQFPSIAQIATSLGHPPSISDYKDWFSPINQSSNANLKIGVNVQGTGKLFEHPTLNIEKLATSTNAFNFWVLDDLDKYSSTDPVWYYSPTLHSSTSPMPISIPTSTHTFGLAPSQVLWQVGTVTSTVTRLGQNFAWWMKATPFYIGRQSGGFGFIGDLWIDPCADQANE